MSDMSDDATGQAIETVIAKAHKYTAQAHIANFELTVAPAAHLDAMVVQLVARVLAIQEEEVAFHADRPRDWRSHWLYDHRQWMRNPSTRLGRWIEDWWEGRIEWESIDFSRTIPLSICPHIAIPKHQAHVNFLLSGHTSRGTEWRSDGT